MCFDLSRLMVSEEELHEIMVYRSMQLLLKQLVVCGMQIAGEVF